MIWFKVYLLSIPLGAAVGVALGLIMGFKELKKYKDNYRSK